MGPLRDLRTRRATDTRHALLILTSADEAPPGDKLAAVEIALKWVGAALLALVAALSAPVHVGSRGPSDIRRTANSVQRGGEREDHERSTEGPERREEPLHSPCHTAS
jgi:hypothetical protein